MTTPAPCTTCARWSRGCSTSTAVQLHRYHGQAGDDSGTVQGWRLLYGVPRAPTDTTAADLWWDGEVACPGHRPEKPR